MDLRAIRAFITVAEELNFRRAAECLGMSQPPLTRLVAQLEEELDAQLLVRSTRKVELTGAGLHLLKRGRELLDEAAKLEREVRTLKRTRNGKLLLALGHGALHTALPRILSSFKEQFPNISITLVEPKQSEIRRGLEAIRFDIYFGANVFRESTLKQLKIQVQELGLLIPKSNVLSLKQSIRLRDLRGEILIYHGKHEHLGFQEEFLEYLLHQGIRPSIYYKKSSEGCGALVNEGKGLLLSTKKSAKHHLDARFVPFADYSPKLKIYATWAQENDSLPVKAFLNFLQESGHLPASEMDAHF